MKMTKSEEKADELRTFGNKFYSERKFFDALIKYNESLCHAPHKSESFGLAFANKSAVYFEMKLYDKCLKNIELAKSNKYPEKNLEVLKKREEKCLELLKQQTKLLDPLEFFKLSYKANRKLPFAVDCLELRTSEKYGKFIETNKKLKVGDVLAIEKPFCSVLLSESKFIEVDGTNKFQRCTNCFRDCQLDLISCHECCEVMFCSEECQQNSRQFHRYECPVMSSILKSGSVNIALRIFFISLSAFNGSVEDLETFMFENDNSSTTVYDFNFSKQNCPENIKNYLKCLNSLSRSSKLFSLQSHTEILSNHPELKEVFNSHETFIRNFLQRQCQTNDLYFHGIFGGSLRKDEGKDPSQIFKNLQVSIGSGWFPFCSLINHSCAPNVMRVYVEGKVVLIVCRPIEKNQQLFDCYKANFNLQPKKDRQARLLSEFLFTCDCEACEKNYPSPPNLPFKDAKLLKFCKKIEDEMLTSKLLNNPLKRYHECCELIEKNHQNFPSLELSSLMKWMAVFSMIQARPSCLFP